jgi:hypothetical protein
MGNAQAIAAFLNSTQKIDLSKIPNLENAISRIVESGTAYEHERELKTLIDVLFAERDAIVRDMMTVVVPKITEEVLFSVALMKTVKENPRTLLEPTDASAPARSFDDLFATQV